LKSSARTLRGRRKSGSGESVDKKIVTEMVDWAVAHSPMSLHTFESGIATLLATLAGGLLTFGFVLLKARRDRKESEIAGGTRALFTLMEMWNATKQHQKEIVDPYRNRNDAWLNLHVGPPLNPMLAFDLKDLTFLMEKSPKVLMDVLLEGNRYRLAVYLVDEHRRLATEVVWPKLEAAGMRPGDPPSPEDEIQKIIGPAALKQMQVVTAAIITNFDENVESLRAVFTSLRTELVRLFPKIRFVNFNFEPQLPTVQVAPQQGQPYYYPHGPGGTPISRTPRRARLRGAR
jgi:hypothetical protein